MLKKMDINMFLDNDGNFLEKTDSVENRSLV